MKHAMICMLLVAVGSATHAASFDCMKAATAIEKEICSDSQLSDLDSQLMEGYSKSLSHSANADLLKSEQRAWLKNVRNKCQESACLKQVYSERISALSENTQPPISRMASETSAPIALSVY